MSLVSDFWRENETFRSQLRGFRLRLKDFYSAQLRRDSQGNPKNMSEESKRGFDPIALATFSQTEKGCKSPMGS